jgi:hypothetical protein
MSDPYDLSRATHNCAGVPLRGAVPDRAAHSGEPSAEEIVARALASYGTTYTNWTLNLGVARRILAALRATPAEPGASPPTGDPGRGTFERGVTCWVCPDCAFTFDAMHTDADGSGYSCPGCYEIEHRAARSPAPAGDAPREDGEMGTEVLRARRRAVGRMFGQDDAAEVVDALIHAVLCAGRGDILALLNRMSNANDALRGAVSPSPGTEAYLCRRCGMTGTFTDVPESPESLKQRGDA